MASKYLTSSLSETLAGIAQLETISGTETLVAKFRGDIANEAVYSLLCMFDSERKASVTGMRDIRSKFSGRCACCKARTSVNQIVRYHVPSKAVYCLPCGGRLESMFGMAGRHFSKGRTSKAYRAVLA